MYGLIYIIGFIVSIIILFSLYRVKNVILGKLLICGTLLVTFWIFMELLIYYIPIPEISIIFLKYKLISAIFIPPLYLTLAIVYYNTKFNTPGFKLSLYIIPAFSLMSLLTNRFPYRFITEIKMEYIDHIPASSFHANFGFRFHTYYSYAVILFACYIFMIKAIHSPRMYKRQSIFIFIGSLLSFLTNIIVISLIFGSAFIDTTSLFVLATLVILYWGMFRLPKTAIVPIARDSFLENIKDIAIILDAKDIVIDMNPAAIDFIITKGRITSEAASLTKINLIGLNITEIYKFFPELNQLSTLQSNRDTLSFQIGDRILYYNIEQSPILDNDQSVIGKLIILHNITKIQEYANSLKLLNDSLILSDRIINSAFEGVLITDIEGNIVKTNPAFQKLSGYSEEELIGKTPRILKSGRQNASFYQNMWHSLLNEGYWSGEIWNCSKTGELYPEWKSITSLRNSDGVIQNFISISTDISRIKDAEEALHNLAYFDELTGLPNKNSFYEILRERLKVTDCEAKFALLFMDLDGFKLINDSLGHAAGDLLLKEVTHRLISTLYNLGSIFRFGGDEFIIIIDNLHSSQDVIDAAESIIKIIDDPFYIHDRQITLGVSIGITIAPEDGTTIDGIVRKADAAMYAAKETGKNRYIFFSDDIDKKNQDTLDMQIRLKSALDNQEFRLLLQPQINYLDGQYNITGAEALIRWRTLDGRFYTPNQFIPISENNGMIIPIGNWIVDEIFRIDRMLKEYGIDIKLSINVSSKQLEDNSLLHRIRDLCQSNPLQKIHLIIEITESFLLQDFDKALESLLEIKKLGVGLALDDFGTGFSSLSYLTRLPIDYLKIDKSFIDGIAIPGSINLTANIIAIAKTLNLKTVAEGVETIDQVYKLLEEKCDELQGYYFNKPLEISDFIEYANSLRHKNRKSS